MGNSPEQPGKKSAAEQMMAPPGEAQTFEASDKYYLDFAEKLFAKPTAGGSSARNAWEALRANDPMNADQMKRVEIIFKEVFERYSTYIEKTYKTEKEKYDVQKKLDALKKEFVDQAVKIGNSVKLLVKPYGESPEHNVFETQELVMFGDYLDRMRSMNQAEMSNMVFENQRYINMMVLAQEKRHGEGTDTPDHEAICLHPGEDHYEKNMGDLAKFILSGRNENMGDQKSEFRKQAEVLLWNEIVRNFDIQQKGDLVRIMLDTFGQEKTRGFIATAIIAEAMTPLDVVHMYEHNPELPKKLGDLKEIKKGMQDVVAAKTDIQDEMRAQLEHKQIDNFVSEMFTFNKIGGELITRCAAIACFVNISLTVFDNIRNSHGEKWYKSGIKGFGNALKDPYVIGSAVTAAAASNIVWPWWKDLAYSKSGQEKEILKNDEVKIEFRDNAENRTEFLIDFYNHFNEYKDVADANLVKRNAQEITVEDVTFARSKKNRPGSGEITPEQAGEWGFPSVMRAKAEIVKLFRLAREKKIENQNGLDNYLKKIEVGPGYWNPHQKMPDDED